MSKVAGPSWVDCVPHCIGQQEFDFLLERLAEIIYKELSQSQSTVTTDFTDGDEISHEKEASDA